MEDYWDEMVLDNWDQAAGSRAPTLRRGSSVGAIEDDELHANSTEKPLLRRHTIDTLDPRFISRGSQKKEGDAADFLSQERRTSSALDSGEDTHKVTMATEPAREPEASQSLMSKLASFAPSLVGGVVDQAGPELSRETPPTRKRAYSGGHLLSRLRSYAPLVRIASGDHLDTAASQTEHHDKLKETEEDFRMINQLSPSSW